MNLFLFAPDLTRTGPLWLNMLWPQVHAIAGCYKTVFLRMPSRGRRLRGRIRSRLADWQEARRSQPELLRRVQQALDPSQPNVLLVWANDAPSMRWSGLLEPVWHLFEATVLVVNDAVQSTDVKADWVARFDRLLFSCADLADEYRANHGVDARHWPAHTDVLGFHGVGDFRPIDMLLVGRRDPARHDPLFRHFNRPGSDRLFLDFVTRGQMLMSHEEEFRLLMTTYGRSKLGFCYETSTIPRYCGKSPLLARWVHAWAAGCTVLGTRPQGKNTAGLMDWPEATIELPADPGETIALVEAVLSDEAGLRVRRRRNAIEALRRHDTRYRLRDLVDDLDLGLSDTLRAELAALTARADALASGL